MKRPPPVESLDDFAELEPIQAARRRPAAEPGSAAPQKVRRPRAEETFVRIPYRVMQLYGRLPAAALFVLFELDHLNFANNGQNPVRLTNQKLGAAGMPRSTKARAVRQLRDVGLITFNQEGREAFIVTLSWHPISP